VLEEKPTNSLDLLETSLLVKKTTFEPKESSPLVPVSVSYSAVHARSACSGRGYVIDNEFLFSPYRPQQMQHGPWRVPTSSGKGTASHKQLTVLLRACSRKVCIFLFVAGTLTCQ
jgi:hypothetical protein